MHFRTHHHANINPLPKRSKHFDVEHMRRIPVLLDDKTREYLMTSNHQGRVIPQALSEFFGTLPDVDHLELRVEEDNERLSIDVKHSHDEGKHHTFFVSLNDIHQVSEHPARGFKAIMKADELLNTYRVKVLREGDTPHRLKP